MNQWTISSNTLVRNEILHIDGFVRNMLAAKIDEIIFLDGGSTDGSYERLLEYEQKYKHIHVLRWKQPENSEFKLGFKETVRRNLMKEASSMDFILYIDIDERIDEDFAKCFHKLEVSESIQSVVFPRFHFWNEGIRVNTVDDRVWSPELGFRLFRRSSNIHFISKDKNGLHNHLAIRNFIIYGAFNKQKWLNLLCKLFNQIIGFRYIISRELKVYHFHYYKLQSLKVNDLRQNEFSYPVVFVASPEKGLDYRLADKVIPCVPVQQDDKLLDIINNYF